VEDGQDNSRMQDHPEINRLMHEAGTHKLLVRLPGKYGTVVRVLRETDLETSVDLRQSYCGLCMAEQTMSIERTSEVGIYTEW
jgi:hypothetical protein